MSDLHHVFENAWVAFWPQTDEKLRSIELAAGDWLSGTLSPKTREAARRAAHQLKGLGGTYGRPLASQVAAAIEQLFQVEHPYLQHLPALVQQLRAALEQPAMTQKSAPSEQILQAPVLIIADDPQWQIDLSHTIALRYATSTSKLDEGQSHMQRCSSRAVVIGAPMLNDQVQKLLQDAASAQIPVILLLDQVTPEIRLQAAHLGLSVLMQAPARPDTVLHELDQLLGEQSAQVLILDDDLATATALQILLQAQGLTVQVITAPTSLWPTLRETPNVDLFVCDLEMPEVSGLDVLRMMRTAPEHRDVPIVMWTMHEQHIVQAFAAGVDDYIPKGSDTALMMTRLQRCLSRSRRQRIVAFTDVLTGAMTRVALLHLVESSLRNSHPIAIVLLDLDRFKQLNDTYGHQMGDEALVHAVRTIKQALPNVQLGRLGGEEFVLVLPGADTEAAMQVAEQALNALRASPLTVPNQPLIALTMSAGVAVSPKHGVDVTTLLHTADKALYQAKRTGRNRVVLAPV